MPSYGPWRSDSGIYHTDVDVKAWGTTQVESTNDGGAGALSGAAAVALGTAGSIGVGLDVQLADTFTTNYLADEGFLVFDADHAISPADPSTVWVPQIPYDDPGTTRADWLGNLPPYDPTLGVEFADPAGTLALDQPLAFTLAGGQMHSFPGPLPDPPTGAVWVVDASVLDVAGGIWTATSIPLDSVDASIAAAAWKHTGIGTIIDTLGVLDFATVHLDVPSSALRSGRYFTVALSTESPAFGAGPTAWGGAFLGAFSILSVPYRNPDYRLIFASRPPLAHRQRRDGTATAGPQLAHIGAAGGRPPLAWRQNNP